MNMPVLVYNRVADSFLTRARVKKIVLLVLAKLKRSPAELSVSIVGEARMRSLNRRQRGVPYPTDVLSFPLNQAVKGQSGGEAELGDIFLCPAYLRRQAKRFVVPYRIECTRSLIHGILHLAGYDHKGERQAAEMFKVQEGLLVQALKRQ